MPSNQSKVEPGFREEFYNTFHAWSLLILVLFSGSGFIGCATSQSWDRDSAPVAYTDSVVDLADRAPASMAIPHDVETTLDNTSMRAQADYHFTLAETYSLEGNPAKAIEEYRLTLVYDQNSIIVRLRLAGEYVKQGMVSEALTQAQTAVEMDPKDVEARMLLGGLYSSLRMYQEATKQYEAVRKLDPLNFDAPMFIGALLAEQKRFKEAAAVFEKLAKNPINQNTHIGWYYYGRVLLELNKDDQGGAAEYAFRKAVEAKPSFTDALLALGSLYETTHRKDRALQLYANYQEKSGPSAAVAEPLAQLYIEKEQYLKALDQYAIIEAADPEDLNARMKSAFILIQEKRYPESIEKLEALLGKVPSADKIRFYLGAVYEEVKDYKSAAAHFLKIPESSSYFAESRIHASYLHKLMGQSRQAVAVMEDAIKVMPDHAPFYSLYTSQLEELGQYKKAETVLVQAVKRFPQSAQLLYILGNVQEKLGNREGTIEAMQGVLALQADNVQALNFLAYIYAEAGQQLEDAEKMARRARELKPDDGFILDTLGWVLFKREQYGDAVKILEEAHRLQPDESVIADHLGDAYYRFRMPERAKQLYQKAVILAEREKRSILESGADGAPGVSLDKVRAKIVMVDRQASGREPASSQSRQPQSQP